MSDGFEVIPPLRNHIRWKFARNNQHCVFLIFVWSHSCQFHATLPSFLVNRWIHLHLCVSGGKSYMKVAIVHNRISSDIYNFYYPHNDISGYSKTRLIRIFAKTGQNLWYEWFLNVFLFKNLRFIPDWKSGSSPILDEICSFHIS